MKYLLFVICVTTAVLLFYIIESTNAEMMVVLKHSACVLNEKYVEKLTKPRQPINRTTSMASVDVIFKPGVSLNSPIYIQVIAFLKVVTQYKPFMFNVKVELCDLLKSKDHLLFSYFYIPKINETTETESNLLDPCPLKGHRFIKSYYTNYKRIPVMPTGEWRVDLSIIKNEDEVLKVQNYYEITAVENQ